MNRKMQGLRIGSDNRGVLFETTGHRLQPLSFRDKLYVARSWLVWFWRVF